MFIKGDSPLRPESGIAGNKAQGEGKASSLNPPLQQSTSQEPQLQRGVRNLTAALQNDDQLQQAKQTAKQTINYEGKGPSRLLAQAKTARDKELDKFAQEKKVTGADTVKLEKHVRAKAVTDRLIVGRVESEMKTHAEDYDVHLMHPIKEPAQKATTKLISVVEQAKNPKIDKALRQLEKACTTFHEALEDIEQMLSDGDVEGSNTLKDEAFEDFSGAVDAFKQAKGKEKVPGLARSLRELETALDQCFDEISFREELLEESTGVSVEEGVDESSSSGELSESVEDDDSSYSEEDEPELPVGYDRQFRMNVGDALTHMGAENVGHLLAGAAATSELVEELIQQEPTGPDVGPAPIQIHKAPTGHGAKTEQEQRLREHSFRFVPGSKEQGRPNKLMSWGTQVKLAQGGFKTVMLADELIGRGKMALLMFAPEGQRLDPDAAKELQGEVYWANRFSGLDNVMQYEGEGAEMLSQQVMIGDVSGLVAKGNLSGGQKQVLMRDMAKGLSGMHSKGAVARDIKEDNYLVLEESPGVYRAYASDFGLCCEASYSHSQSGGTLPYMAPEVNEERMEKFLEEALKKGRAAAVFDPKAGAAALADLKSLAKTDSKAQAVLQQVKENSGNDEQAAKVLFLMQVDTAAIKKVRQGRDSWALGVSFCRMLGLDVVYGFNPNGLGAGQITGKMGSLQQQDMLVPHEDAGPVEHLICRMCRVDPTERPSMKEIEEELAKLKPEDFEDLKGFVGSKLLSSIAEAFGELDDSSEESARSVSEAPVSIRDEDLGSLAQLAAGLEFDLDGS